SKKRWFIIPGIILNAAVLVLTYFLLFVVGIGELEIFYVNGCTRAIKALTRAQAVKAFSRASRSISSDHAPTHKSKISTFLFFVPTIFPSFPLSFSFPTFEKQ